MTGWKPDKNKGGRATRIQDKVLFEMAKPRVTGWVDKGWVMVRENGGV